MAGAVSLATMINDASKCGADVTANLAAKGYWAARAAQALKDGRYAAAVEICRDHLDDHNSNTAGRVIYARALYHAGQTDAAAEQFRIVLRHDQDHLVALKYLGDILYENGQEAEATTHYERVLRIDPGTHGLSNPLSVDRQSRIRTITLGRERETAKADTDSLRRIPFFTETMGDLYLKQGYPRLAAEVFRRLSEEHDNPRLARKLKQAKDSIKQ